MEEQTNRDELKQSFSSLVEDLRGDKAMTYFDAEELYRRLDSHCELAEGHIYNSISLRKKEADKFNTMKGKAAVKTSINENKVCPVELLNHLKGAFDNLIEQVNWERLKYEVINLYNRKLYNAYMTTKSFEIEKEVSKGFEERQKQWMELTKSILTNKFETLNNRMIGISKSFEQLKSANEGKYFALNEKLLKVQNTVLKQMAELPVSKDDIEAEETFNCDYCGISFATQSELEVHKPGCKDILMEPSITDPVEIPNPIQDDVELATEAIQESPPPETKKPTSILDEDLGGTKNDFD